MISDEELARTADRLHDALHAAADVMTVHDNAATTGERRHARAWLIPLTAAACVIAIVTASVAIVRGSSPVGQPQAPGATPPEFYATFMDTFPDGNISTQLQVRRTSTGQVTAVAPLPAGWMSAGQLFAGAGVTAAADDRRFFVTAYQAIRHPGTCPISRFYRLTITGTGRVSDFGPMGPPINGDAAGSSVSPDGSHMAYGLVRFHNIRGECATVPENGVIYVLDLTSGAVRSWHDTAPATAVTHVRGGPGPLSWRPDGRTLIVGYSTAIGYFPQDQAVLALDTSSPGGSLQAHSHLLWSQDRRCTLCLTAVISGPAGSLIATAAGRQGNRYVLEVLKLGGPVLATVPNPDQADWQLRADASGRYVIISNTSSAGWISDGKLNPLPAGSRPWLGIAW